MERPRPSVYVQSGASCQTGLRSTLAIPVDKISGLSGGSVALGIAAKKP